MILPGSRAKRFVRSINVKWCVAHVRMKMVRGNRYFCRHVVAATLGDTYVNLSMAVKIVPTTPKNCLDQHLYCVYCKRWFIVMVAGRREALNMRNLICWQN
jgi:hypothetical protein